MVNIYWYVRNWNIRDSWIHYVSVAENLHLTQKQVVDEVIDIKYLSQIIVTDISHKYCITKTYNEVLYYKNATNIVWDSTDSLHCWVVSKKWCMYLKKKGIYIIYYLC